MDDIKAQFHGFGYTTPAFSLAGHKCWARLVSCYDGDSPTLVFSYGGKMYKYLTRMYGLDTCEMHSKDENIRQRAVKARNRLISLATKHDTLPALKSNKDIVAFLDNGTYLVWVECMDFDKYGRPLVKIMASPDATKTFADILIEEKLAYAYSGATKMSEEHQKTVISDE